MSLSSRILGGMILAGALRTAASGQTLYWTEPSGIFRKILPIGDNETVLPRNHRPYAAGVAVDAFGGKLYWTTRSPNGIERSNLDGSNVERLIEFPSNPALGLALDVQGGKMYWPRSYLGGPGRIQRANLDGSDIEDLVVADAPTGSDIALDLAHGKMYWTDWGLDVIRRANLDGTGIETLISTGLSAPRGIALDLVHGRMYWSDFAGSFGTGKVESARLDGSDRKLHYNRLGVEPAGIAVDPASGKVFWMDDEFLFKGLYVSNLDGTDAHQLVEVASGGESGGFVYGLGIDEQAHEVYFANYGEQTIYRSSSDGSEVVDVFSTEVLAPHAIAFDPSRGQLLWTDSGLIGQAMTSGAMVRRFYLEGMLPVASVSVDPSTRSFYYLEGGGSPVLVREALDVHGLRPLHPLPYPTSASAAIALDLAHGHVFWSFIDYPTVGRIRRADLDGSNETIIVDLDDEGWTRRMGGLSVDAVHEKLYWWTNLEGRGPRDEPGLVLFRANLDGTDVEPLEEWPDNQGDLAPGVLVAPWEGALFVTNFHDEVIQTADLDATLFETVAQARALGVAFDSCGSAFSSGADRSVLLARCLAGPTAPLPESCACADLTGEGFVDLRDVSAAALSPTVGLTP